MDNKGNGGALKILGVFLLIVAIVIALATGYYQVNSARDNPQNPNIIPILGWIIVGVVLAILFMVLGALLIILG